jgi:hypothetical protein
LKRKAEKEPSLREETFYHIVHYVLVLKLKKMKKKKEKKKRKKKEIMSDAVSLLDVEDLLREVQTTSGKFIFDIEGTGKLLKDNFVAIGFAYNRKDGTVVKGYLTLNLLSDEEREHLKKGWISFYDIWYRNQWEIRCYTEFWNNSKRPLLPKLEMLLEKNENLCETRFELAARFNCILREAEEHWEGNLQIVTNTTAYDTCWVHSLLTENHFQPLDTTRSGKHTWSYDSDSALIGALGITPQKTNWRKFGLFLQKPFQRLPGEQVEHDHHPMNDARHILDRWERFEVFQAMVPTSLLDVLVASPEEYPMLMQRHITEYVRRIHFLRGITPTTCVLVGTDIDTSKPSSSLTDDFFQI